MKRGFKIYLFRHGMTTYNRDGRFTGWNNPRLTEKGMKNARAVARELKDKRFGVAIHTKLTRSKQTLKEVLKFHPECKEIIEDNRMIERNYGDLNGKTHSQFIRTIGEKTADFLEKGDLIGDLDEEARREAEKFLGEKEYDLIHRGFFVSAENGESFEDVEKRVSSFIKDIKKMIKNKQTNIAISAHGNSIRLFRKLMEKASIEESLRWFIPYDRVFEYTIK